MQGLTRVEPKGRITSFDIVVFDGSQDTGGALCCKNTFDLMGTLLEKFSIPIKLCVSLPSSASSHICIYVYIHVYMYVDICILLKEKFALFCSVVALHLSFTEYSARECTLNML